eukprot:7996468-Heterocapsa_arctica.AAC.1
MEEDAERTAGIPPGSVRFGNTMFFRKPDNDWLYDLGWVPTGEGWRRKGKEYLTDSSPHAREVFRMQMAVTKEMAAARSLPDGWDGPALRQLLEVLSGAVGGLTNGQVEMFMGSFGLWMATKGGAHPPHFDDVLRACGLWTFASAVMYTCGMPMARCRPGDWKCPQCGFSNHAFREKCVGKGGECKCPASFGLHAFGDDASSEGVKEVTLTARPGGGS